MGDRVENCREALRRLHRISGVQVIRSSSAFETEPVGEGLEGWFINAVAEAETDVDPAALVAYMQQIEVEMGRKKGRVRANRPIDLDLLFYGDLRLESKGLIVPHPLLHRRRFVLEPLNELVPAQIHPGLGKKVKDLWMELKDPHQVRWIEAPLWEA
jgi:2-amino-4-hydroxy-6-hydroxymethyldihydropteridine diphosphokinase